jgi:hypothetical protein
MRPGRRIVEEIAPFSFLAIAAATGGELVMVDAAQIWRLRT